MANWRYTRWAGITIAVCCFHAGAMKAIADAPVANRGEIRAMSHAEQIEQLRDDDVRYNAFYAVLSLYEWMNEETIAQLDDALDSDCWQQRQLSAWLLRKESRYAMSEKLCQVTVEGLRCDALPLEILPDGSRRYTSFFNAADGVRYLVDQPLEYPEPLVEALESDDQQQRFLAAYILGAHGWEEDRERLVELLAKHLRDDDIRNNALFACYALYQLGPEARPYLIEYLDSDDEQQVAAVELILYNWENPPQTAEDLRERSEMHNLSNVILDPTVAPVHHNRFVRFPVE